jgi:thiol-disulfide isomerase/thioredoxin
MTVLRRALTLVLVLGLIGCGGREKDDSSPSSTDPGGGQNASPLTLKEVTHADAMTVVEQSDASITVINFWATWCVPCVEEFPAFVKLDERLDDRGVDVMFISTDFPNQKDKVVDFLDEQGVAGPSYLKTGKTTPFVNGFSEEWSGAVPATFIYDDNGTLLDFWEGKVSYDELKHRVTTQLEAV